MLSSSSVAGAVAVFELGNEPNLNVYTESGGTWNGTQYTSPWSGFSLGEQPYGWDIPEYIVDNPNDPDEYLEDCPTNVQALARPIWITEYGFQTPSNYAAYDPQAYGDAVANEDIKAQYYADQFTILRATYQFSGPIILYTATDYPVTATDWSSDDSSGNEGGFGLFEWCRPDGSTHTLQEQPAFEDQSSLRAVRSPGGLMNEAAGTSGWIPQRSVKATSPATVEKRAAPVSNMK